MDIGPSENNVVRALRAVRVLRPIKLVSGVPSIYLFIYLFA